MNPALLTHPEWTGGLATLVAATAVALATAQTLSRRRGARLVPGGPAAGRRNLWGDVALLAALVAIAAALLGPRIGERVALITSSGVDVVILLDVSQSMDAGDVPPTRMDRARGAAREILARLHPEDRVAVAAFASRGVLLTPLTPDRDALNEVLASLDTSLMQPASSQLGEGVRAALEAFEVGSQRPRSVLILSDGEDSARGRRLAAAEAVRRRARIVTAALGSDEGGHVPDGARPLRAADGTLVVSRRQTAHLEALARATGGRSFRGDRWGRFDFDTAVAAIRRGAASATGEPARQRVGAVRVAPFAAVAFALLLAESLPFTRGVRRRTAPALAVTAALGFLAFSAVIPVRAENGFGSVNQPPPGTAGADPASDAPLDARALIAAGIADLERGRNEAAAQKFLAAAIHAREADVAAVARYDLGVAALAAGDLPRARDAFFAALVEDPADRAARFNLEWTIGQLERQQTTSVGSRGAGADATDEERQRIARKREDSRRETPGSQSTQGVLPLGEEQRRRWLDRVIDDPSQWLRAAAATADEARRPRAGPAW